jgi:L-2,4-diaminobutyrate decarboxylase
MKHQNPIIAEMFNTELFAETGHHLIDLLSSYLKTNLFGTTKVLNWKAPTTDNINWQGSIPKSPTIDRQELINKLAQELLPNSLAIHHPHNMGHQISSPLPIAALCDMVAALTNQAMAIYEAGPSATMLERQVINWLCNLIQVDDNWSKAGGVLTSGGAQANLTALLAARQITANRIDHSSNIWKDGVAKQPRLRILASENAHYTISRAAGIMGLGSAAVIKVATDNLGRIDLNALKAEHQTCILKNEVIIAIVASAGCTPTGSIDCLETIGKYCKTHKIWFHVDGAHGASALLSNEHSQTLRGIELADSVVWDGHKLMYMPATVSAVLFRDEKHSYAAFSQDASYLFQGKHQDEEAFNLGYRTLECTKRMMGLKLWAAFSLYGKDGMGALVDEAFAKAQLLATKIEGHPDFELLMNPQTNIVCFRHLKKKSSLAQSNQYQTALRQHIIQNGDFYISQVDLNHRTWLRATLMNPYTLGEDLDELLNSIIVASQAPSIMAEYPDL